MTAATATVAALLFGAGGLQLAGRSAPSAEAQTVQTALCDAVAARVRADKDVVTGARTVWSVLTTTSAPLVEIASAGELSLQHNPEPEDRWQFEKRLKSLYGNADAVLKDLQRWDDFQIFTLPRSAVHMVLRTGGTTQCESRYFFRVTTAREVVRVPDPPDKTPSDFANAICENDGAWGYFGHVNGAEAFVEYRAADTEESLRIVPLQGAEWQPACSVSARFEPTAAGRGRLQTVQVAQSK